MSVLSKKQQEKIDQYFFAVAAGSDPCGWRQPILSVWRKYEGTVVGEIMYRRYFCKEKNIAIMKSLHIPNDSYFRYIRECLISAALAGLKAGLDI